MNQLPISDADSVTREWWDATREKRFVLQTCRVCNHHQHYPRPVCTRCGSVELGYEEASGRGLIYSFTVSHRAPGPEFETPYVVALIKLEEGPIILSNIVDADPESLGCDMPVQVTWEDLPDGRALPKFTISREVRGE